MESCRLCADMSVICNNRATDGIHVRPKSTHNHWFNLTQLSCCEVRLRVNTELLNLFSSSSHSPHVFIGYFKHRGTVCKIPVMFHSELLELLASKYFSRTCFELYLSKRTIPHHSLCTTQASWIQTTHSNINTTIISNGNLF